MRLKLLIIVFVSLCTWTGAGSPAMAAGEIIRIAGAQAHTTHALAAEVVKEAYRRIGFDARISYLPNRRALIAAAGGQFDGELGRIAGAEKNYPTLVRVPVPVVWIDGVAATVDKTADIKAWKDLDGLPVAIIRGELYAEEGTSALSVPPLHVNDYSQLLAMLLRGRAKVVIGIRADLNLEISRNILGQHIKVGKTPLFSAPLYHFVHESRRALVPRLEAVLRKMADEGDIEKLHKRALERLMLK